MVAGSNKDLLIFEVERFELVETLTGCGNWTSDLCFSACGRFLAQASNHSSILIWDFLARRLKATLTKSNEWVLCLDFSHSSLHLASGTQSGEIMVWSLDDCLQIKHIKFNNHQNQILSQKFIKDDFLVVGQLYNKIRILNQKYEVFFEFEHRVFYSQSIGISRCQDQLAACNDHTLSIFDLNQLTLKHAIPLKQEGSRLEFSPDDRFLMMFLKQQKSPIHIYQKDYANKAGT